MNTQIAMNSTVEVLMLIELASEKDILLIIGPHKGRILADEEHKTKPKHVL